MWNCEGLKEKAVVDSVECWREVRDREASTVQTLATQDRG